MVKGNKPRNSLFLALLGGAIIFSLLIFALVTTTTASVVLTPSEVLEAIKTAPSSLNRVRVVGQVADSDVLYKTERPVSLQFFVEDKDVPASVKLRVIYNDVKPDMFAPKRHVLIDGEVKDGTLIAHSLLTQCPSKYEPPDK
jgi:cytochrome c-type biogenesis protein CcmE